MMTAPEQDTGAISSKRLNVPYHPHFAASPHPLVPAPTRRSVEVTSPNTLLGI